MKLLILPNNDSVKELYNDSVTREANITRERRGDAGFDLYFPEDMTIGPKETKSIDLKIQCEAFSDSENTKNVSYYLHCRSSISKTPLRLANSVGIIDSGYRGNLMVVVDNISNETYNIQKGQRLFQITGRYLEFIECNLTERLSETDRGNQGFGSTGQ